MSNNLILVGMPGTGKTTIGKPLAEQLGKIFRDSDDDILEETGKDVADWLDLLGNDGFLSFEARFIQMHYADMVNTVLSTGGSVPLVQSSADFLKQRGKVIFLDTPVEVIEKRAPKMRVDRIVGMTGNPPHFRTFRELLEFRYQRYTKMMDQRIEVDSKSVDEILSEIISGVQFDTALHY